MLPPQDCQRVHGPSPLQKVHYARPLSTLSSLNAYPTSTSKSADSRRSSMMPDRMGNDDAEFWQRFNVAAHGIGMEDVESLGSTRLGTPAVEIEDPHKHEVPDRQRAKRRRTHIIVWTAGITIASVITAVAVIGWWFSQGKSDSERD